MLFELEDTSKVKELFAKWEETLIFSCLQKIMGKIYVTDLQQPQSAFAFVGCFGFYAGAPDREIVMNKPDGFVIMVPQNKEWERLIEECYPSAKKVTRYAIRKDTVFDKKSCKMKSESCLTATNCKSWKPKCTINVWKILQRRTSFLLLGAKRITCK